MPACKKKKLMHLRSFVYRKIDQNPIFIVLILPTIHCSKAMLSPKGQRNEELMGTRKCHSLTLDTNTPQCIFSDQHEFQKLKFLLYTELEMKPTGER